MERLHLLYAVVGVVCVLLALAGRPIRNLPLSEPLAALVVGVLVGPAVLGLVNVAPGEGDLLLLEGSRILLAWSVMAAALRFPMDSLRALLGPTVILLAVAMPAAAVVAGAAALLLGLPLALAAVVGACLCPTDPVLAASVVTGEPAERVLPERLRTLLTSESGANDGLALPIVATTVALALPATGPGDMVLRVVWEVLGGAVVGLVVGLLAGAGLRWASRHGDLGPGPDLVFTLLLAVAVLGTARLAGTGGVLAVFVAGLAHNHAVGPHDRDAQDRLNEAVNRYAVVPLFVLLGIVLPWSAWASFGLPAVAFVAAVLLLRRPPVVLSLRHLLRLSRGDAVFVGWFGPIGVSAIFYLAHSRHEGLTDPRLFAAGTLAIAASVLAFGLSATPGRRLYQARAVRRGDP